MNDEHPLKAKATATEKRAASNRVVADEVAAAIAAASPQTAASLSDEGEHEHRAVRTWMRFMNDNGGGPRVYVFLPDGRTTEFKTRPLIIPETSEEEADTQVLYLAINGRGQPLVDAITDKPVILPEIPLTVQVLEDPNGLVSIKEATRRANVSEATMKRNMKNGDLKPVPVGKRGVRLRVDDLKRWLEKNAT